MLYSKQEDVALRLASCHNCATFYLQTFSYLASYGGHRTYYAEPPQFSLEKSTANQEESHNWLSLRNLGSVERMTLSALQEIAGQKMRVFVYR